MKGGGCGLPESGPVVLVLSSVELDSKGRDYSQEILLLSLGPSAQHS